MMRGFVGVAALGWVVDASAKALRSTADDEERQWRPAEEAVGAMPLMDVRHPKPTNPPRLADGWLRRRAPGDNTCAYISGSADRPLECAASSSCAFDPQHSHVGCCPQTEAACNVWARCIDSTDASLFSTSNGLTLMCGSSDRPHCRTNIYEDERLEGFTLLLCAKAAGTDSVRLSPIPTTTSTTSASSSATTLSSSTTALASTTIPPPSPSAVIGITSATSTRISISSSTTAPVPAPSELSIGAVLGIALGSIVVLLALIGPCIWYCCRRYRKNRKRSLAAKSCPTPPADRRTYPHATIAVPMGLAIVPVDANYYSAAKPSFETSQSDFNHAHSPSPPPPQGLTSPYQGFRPAQ